MDGETQLRRVRSVRRHQARVLTAWSVGSMLVGFVLWFVIRQHLLLNATGSQFFIWGGIDLVFAILGLRQAATAEAMPIDESTIRTELDDRDKLLKFLRFNTFLNYTWVGSGLVLLALAIYFSNNAALLGHGVGVTIQGGYLFLADRVFERRLQAIS